MAARVLSQPWKRLKSGSAAANLTIRDQGMRGIEDLFVCGTRATKVARGGRFQLIGLSRVQMLPLRAIHAG